VCNKTYARARRGGLVSAGEILEELVGRAANCQRFYRPKRRQKPGELKPNSPCSLSWFAHEPVPRDDGRPLFDLIPEAYD
jgi:hypothetical protein